jgi:hypothetical protein
VDTSIRDFIGLVENDWDVLAPAAAAGVQPLTITDEMRRMVDALFSTDKLADQIATPGGGEACPSDGQTEGRTAAADQQSIAAPQEIAAAGGGAETRELSDAAKNAEEASHSSAAALPLGEPSIAVQQIDSASQTVREELPSSGVAGRRGHGRALPT